MTNINIHEATIKWHNLHEDPRDIPSENETVLVTATCIGSTDYVVYGSIHCHEKENGYLDWYDDISDDPLNWYYEIHAWAYYPNPIKPANETPSKVRSDP